MVGAALLTAYKNAGGAINLRESVMEMLNRGKAVPGGTCGFWGACGRNQRRYVCIYLVWGDATDGGILGTFESDDIKSTEAISAPAVRGVVKRFLSGDSGGG